MKQQLKFKSLQSLSVLVNPDMYTGNWDQFLKANGHTSETFGYLPDHLKLSMKFSFAKKQRPS